MGTNYYWMPAGEPCPSCGHDAREELHIGKSSGGWCFSLNTHPEHGILDLDDWMDQWKTGSIRDEYGMNIDPHEMHEIITERGRQESPNWTASEYARNHAMPGPKNLIRHIVDGQHCIAHGKGTFDLMRGWFI